MKLIKRILGFIYGKSRQFYYERRYNEFKHLYKINSTFGFNGTDIRIYGEGNIIVGENSYIGSNSTIQLNKENTVFIGHNCQISHNVRMYTASTDPNQDFTKKKTKPNKTGNITIGDGVWIGANVFINPNITIGDNSVIGANSVVTKNIEKNAIYGGVPAKLIKYKSL